MTGRLVQHYTIDCFYWRDDSLCKFHWIILIKSAGGLSLPHMIELESTTRQSCLFSVTMRIVRQSDLTYISRRTLKALCLFRPEVLSVGVENLRAVM